MLECNTVGGAINVSHCRANILFKFVPQFNFNEVERKLLRIHYSAEHLERQFAYFALRRAKKKNGILRFYPALSQMLQSAPNCLGMVN